MADEGVSGLIILNKAKMSRFHQQRRRRGLFGRTGVNLSALTRKCISKGWWSGMGHRHSRYGRRCGRQNSVRTVRWAGNLLATMIWVRRAETCEMFSNREMMVPGEGRQRRKYASILAKPETVRPRQLKGSFRSTIDNKNPAHYYASCCSRPRMKGLPWATTQISKNANFFYE